MSAMPTGHEQHEVLMIGTRGDIPAPLPAQQARSVGKASVGAHSEKPAVFAEIIERAQPNLPKLNMFARRVATLARVVEWLTEAKDCRKLGGGTRRPRRPQSYNKPTPSRFACPFPWCIFFSAGDSPLDNTDCGQASLWRRRNEPDERYRLRHRGCLCPNPSVRAFVPDILPSECRAYRPLARRQVKAFDLLKPVDDGAARARNPLTSLPVRENWYQQVDCYGDESHQSKTGHDRFH